LANVEANLAESAIWSMDLVPPGKHVMPWRLEDELKRLGANTFRLGCGAMTEI
jgi:hypothetical protein